MSRPRPIRHRAGGWPGSSDVSDGHIVARCVQPLVDEGQRLLAEGVAQRASDIDLVWVLGYGFPASKGGPLWWAAGQGLQTLPQPVVS